MIKKKSGKVLVIIIGFIISVIGLLNVIALSNPSKEVLLIIGSLLIIFGIILIVYGFNILKKGKH